MSLSSTPWGQDALLWLRGVGGARLGRICALDAGAFSSRRPIASNAKARKAQQHHGPGRGFRNFPDDECEVLIRAAPPRPFVDARRDAETLEGLAAIGRDVREEAVGQ